MNVDGHVEPAAGNNVGNFFADDRKSACVGPTHGITSLYQSLCVVAASQYVDRTVRNGSVLVGR